MCESWKEGRKNENVDNVHSKGGGKWKGSKGESNGPRQHSKLRHEKNCCSQENSSLTSASHSNNGGL